MSSAASSSFRFLVLRTFFFSKIHLHPAAFCILRFPELLACGVEVHPTWRWGLSCQQLLSCESCWLAEALQPSWQWAGQFCEVLRTSSYPGTLMALKSSSLIWRVGLQLRASRGSIPWSGSRTLVLQWGGKVSVRNTSVIWPPLIRGASTKLILINELSFSDNPYVQLEVSITCGVWREKFLSI